MPATCSLAEWLTKVLLKRNRGFRLKAFMLNNHLLSINNAKDKQIINRKNVTNYFILSIFPQLH